ncbi:MAG: hypothetical protein ACOC7L_01670, partial [Acidobacteriota bacterium]
MKRLLCLAVVRHLGRHPWQAGLATLGITLGVAVAVSIDLANASAVRAFELATTTLAGRATHAVEAEGQGLSDRLATRIAREPGIGPAAPVVEGYGVAYPVPPEVPGGPGGPADPGTGASGSPEAWMTLQVLGIDPFAEGPFRPGLTAVAPAEVAGPDRGRSE